jgi:hypothetical protein
MLDSGKTEVADRVVELGDEEEGTDTEPAQVLPVGGEKRDGIGTTHGRIVGPGAWEWKQGWTESRSGGFVIPEPDE